MHRLPLLAVASALVLLTGCKVAVSPDAVAPASSHPAHKMSHSSTKTTNDPSAAHPAGIGTGPLRLLIEPADGLTAIYKLITGARSSVNLTMYELRDTTAEKDLAADAARGVDVRVLLDRHLEKSRNSATYSYLAAHKVHVAWASSGTTYHQKTLTVDGTTSVIMTLNMVSADYPGTRDFAVITTVTSTPRLAAASSAEVTVESFISSFSTASVRCAALMTARIDAWELVGDQTRSAPSGGVMPLWAKSALNVAVIAATSGRAVSITAKSLVPG